MTKIPPNHPRYTALLLSSRFNLPKIAITRQWNRANKVAQSAPYNPIKAPNRTCIGEVSIILPLIAVRSQMGAMGRPDNERKTTRHISPQKMASIKCSKYSTPNRLHTSRANKLPPNGAPKKAASAPPIPMRVCFLTTLMCF